MSWIYILHIAQNVNYPGYSSTQESSADTLKIQESSKGTLEIQESSEDTLEQNNAPLISTTSLAKWLRRLPREREIRGSNSGRIITVAQQTGSYMVNARIV